VGIISSACLDGLDRLDDLVCINGGRRGAERLDGGKRPPPDLPEYGAEAASKEVRDALVANEAQVVEQDGTAKDDARPAKESKGVTTTTTTTIELVAMRAAEAA